MLKVYLFICLYRMGEEVFVPDYEPDEDHMPKIDVNNIRRGQIGTVKEGSVHHAVDVLPM